MSLEALVGNLPDSVQAQIWREGTKVGRLLESAAAAIMATTEAAQLAKHHAGRRAYSRPDLSPAWRWRRRWPEYVETSRADDAVAVRAGTDGARHA